MHHIPDRYCHNCHQPLPSKDSGFCDHCGQKYTTGRITFRSLLVDLVDAIFNFDSRIIRTLRAIWSPGKLTVAYFKGRHRRYLHPIRLFLVLAVAHFALIGFLVGPDLEESLREDVEDDRRTTYRYELRQEIDSLQAELSQEQFDTTNLRIALDTLFSKTEVPLSYSREVSYFKLTNFGIVDGNVELSPHDFYYTPISELVEQQGFTTWTEAISFSQVLKIQREGASASRFFLGQLIWVAVSIIVLLALWLKLVYIRRKRYLVEHAVFVLHFHAFAFMLGSLAMIIEEADDRLADLFDGTMYGISFLWVVFYLYKAIKTYYGQKRFKRVIKWLLTCYMYLMFAIFALIFVAFTSLIFF